MRYFLLQTRSSIVFPIICHSFARKKRWKVKKKKERSRRNSSRILLSDIFIFRFLWVSSLVRYSLSLREKEETMSKRRTTKKNKNVRTLLFHFYPIFSSLNPFEYDLLYDLHLLREKEDSRWIRKDKKQFLCILRYSFSFFREREREERDRRRRKLNFFSSFEYRFLYYLLFPPRENNEYTESKEFLCSTSFPYFLSQISSSIAPSFPLSFFRRRRPSERGENEREEKKRSTAKSESKKKGVTSS